MLAVPVLLGLACLVSASVVSRPKTIPFDGQYIHPNASNSAVEWWWGSAIAEPVDGNIPASFQYLFYQGYPIAFGPRDPSLPEFYVVLNGFFPNGTKFAGTIPASSGTVTAAGEKVTGTWGGAGGFKGAPDLSTFTITLDAPQFGFVGTVKLRSRLPHHFACNTTEGPYFNSIVDDDLESLSETEKILFTQLGWAVAVPGAIAEVDMTILGTKLQFTGQGYHDANWAPVPLNEIVSTWFFGTATVGEYDLSFVSATPLGSDKILNTGYLAHKGVVLQNQCSLQGAASADHSAITLYGLEHDPISRLVYQPVVDRLVDQRHHSDVPCSSRFG